MTFRKNLRYGAVNKPRRRLGETGADQSSIQIFFFLEIPKEIFLGSSSEVSRNMSKDSFWNQSTSFLSKVFFSETPTGIHLKIN